ncbi:helix-turn-helix domain-containing protein [Rhodospirillales bacterium]|nr:helix-turn-helix domain-containing protein [Rhodospirillales bacterium]
MTTEKCQRLTYSPKEAMEMITASKNWFYEAVKRGDIPSVKIGNKILIPKKSFDEMFEISLGRHQR